MNILERIIEAKKQEVAYKKEAFPELRLKKNPLYERKCHSLKSALLRERASGIIAEFKQKSPSRGIINHMARVEEVTRNYSLAGATGLSVLTDSAFFGGSLDNLLKAREANPEVPILRKDFMIDPYQLTEAKASGADVILLIAACLDKEKACELAREARSLGMEVLMEVHTARELEKVNDFVDMVGVNNRNLETFEVDVETSVRLGRLINDNFVKISESGISEASSIQYLRENGYRGFLIGETFMKTADPGEACKQFISAL